MYSILSGTWAADVYVDGNDICAIKVWSVTLSSNRPSLNGEAWTKNWHLTQQAYSLS